MYFCYLSNLIMILMKIFIFLFQFFSSISYLILLCNFIHLCVFFSLFLSFPFSSSFFNFRENNPLVWLSFLFLHLILPEILKWHCWFIRWFWHTFFKMFLFNSLHLCFDLIRSICLIFLHRIDKKIFLVALFNLTHEHLSLFRFLNQLIHSFLNDFFTLQQPRFS